MFFKFLFFSILVLWLAGKVAKFIVRWYLKKAGFSFTQQGRAKPPTASGGGKQAAGPAAEPTRHVTDSLGEYVDYEEVK